MTSFHAYQIHNENGQHRAGIEQLGLDDIGDGDLLIQTRYSSINYKDALAGTGRGKILRRFPLIGGIDSCGDIVQSNDANFAVSDQVLVTGCGLSETRNGGYSEWLRIPANIAVPLPAGLGPFEAMAIGTAGFTAALALHRMEQNGQTPDMGPIVITGASGGVGCLAIDIFSRRGYEVVAVSNKKAQWEFLQSLGAARVINREALLQGKQPLEKALCGGAVDTAGGEMLSRIIASTQPWGSIASIGLAAGMEFSSTVMPFILRGVSLLGIDSATCPYDLRCRLWQRLATDLKPHHLEEIVTQVITLEDLDRVFEELLAGRTSGRTLVTTGSRD